MKQTAVEWLANHWKKLQSEGEKMSWQQIIDITELAKEMEKEQKGYSEEEVDGLVDILQKCEEYFLLKTDSKSDERADAIGEVLKQFKKK